jgi:hypothetical protein
MVTVERAANAVTIQDRARGDGLRVPEGVRGRSVGEDTVQVPRGVLGRGDRGVAGVRMAKHPGDREVPGRGQRAGCRNHRSALDHRRRKACRTCASSGAQYV